MSSLQSSLLALKNPEKAALLQRFFKTGKGEYAEGDIFIGIMVPQIREIIKQFHSLSLKEIQSSLKSKYHEERLAALLILVYQFEKNPNKREEIYDLYISNTKNINNWDLVDLSAPRIVGHFLLDKDKSKLFQLARSNLLWDRRIAIISTAYFIRESRFEETLHIAEILLKDKHDLIHKAVGWMLREVGKKDLQTLKSFLNQHHSSMSRTSLRYAIERFPEKERKAYLD